MNQMWRESQQLSALGARLEDEMELTVLQIPNATVNQTRRSARRSAGEVILLDERDGEPAQRGVARDAAPSDAAADDEQVELMACQLSELLAAPPQRVIHRVNSKAI